MPTLDDLNDIKSTLLTLGDEPGILAAKGEVPVDIGPPETGLSDDLNALFDDFADVEDPSISTETSSDDSDNLSETLFEDFDLDLDDEPAFDMDGFDAPEPPVPEQFDELTVPPVEGDMDGFDAPESDLPVPEQFDELTVPPAEEDTDGLDEETSLLEEELPIDEPDLDIGNEEDLSFDELEEEALDFADPADGDLTFNDLEEDPLDFDDPIESLLDEEPPVDEPNLIEEPDFDIGPDLDIGNEEELSFDDISEPAMDDELLSDDLDLEDDIDFEPDSEDLGFEDLVGISDTDDSMDNSEEAESAPEEMSVEDELSFDDSDDIGFGDDLDLSATDDFDFEDSSGLSLDDSDAADFDLSGEDLDFEDTGSIDDFGAPEEELDLGGDEELSLDDSDSGDMDLDEFEISDDGFDEDLEIDEFDLGDLGQDFGVLEEDLSSIKEDEILLDENPDSEEDLEEEEEEFEIEQKSFDRVKLTLKNLPRNLKLIIEEEIGEKSLKGPSLKKLIDALSEGKSPKEIAAITSKITGKKIKIPANYSKRTGSDFEEEKGSFQYTLMHKVIPLLKIFLISLVIISGISFTVYKFIYKPVHAYILYNRGYDQLEESNYNRSVELFDQAFDKYKMKKQFYRFAEGYIEHDQWDFARNQYDSLLENYPLDKKGSIDYASMEYEKLSDYEHATEILNNFLDDDKNNRDYEALFLLGDIYLEWGWEDYNKYEDARLAYAKIMGTYGLENKILFRMLRYFIRTDNAEEVEILKKRFQFDKEQEIDPLAYAELAGYQIDRQDIGDVEELLFRAKDVDDTIPEIHYQLARLFKMTDEGEEEDKALIKTISKLESIQILNRRNREIKIDSLRRQGERFYKKREFLQAEEVYNKGIDLLTESRERNIIKGKSPVYGELYSDLGHIYYYISENPENALNLYETAESEGFSSPEIYYNKGNIRYRWGEYREALLDFYNSAGSFSVNTNLLQATANTLYQRNDYFAAQGYYSHLLDLLESKVNSEFSIRINEREDHRVMVESLMKAYNNMGVTLYGLFERTGDPSKFTSAMLNFTRSNEYFDDLTRDPETMNRTEMINLASLNQRKMLYPIPDYELQIFADIPKRLVP